MTYTPPTMQPVRPGANDAIKIPGLSNGKREAYKPPVAMCVSTVKAAGFAK